MVVVKIFQNIYFCICFAYNLLFKSFNMIVFDRSFNYSRPGRRKRPGKFNIYVTTIKHFLLYNANLVEKIYSTIFFSLRIFPFQALPQRITNFHFNLFFVSSTLKNIYSTTQILFRQNM